MTHVRDPKREGFKPSERNHGGGILQGESCRRSNAVRIMEKESWRKNHAVAHGRHLEESWRRLLWTPRCGLLASCGLLTPGGGLLAVDS